MKKLALSSLALFVMTTSAMTLHTATSSPSRSEAAMNAAYRDGLYLGKLAAEQGNEAHVATARWALTKDRESFAAGYQQSYSAVLASRSAESNEAGR
jgi:hypothetical protein